MNDELRRIIEEILDFADKGYPVPPETARDLIEHTLRFRAQSLWLQDRFSKSLEALYKFTGDLSVYINDPKVPRYDPDNDDYFIETFTKVSTQASNVLSVLRGGKCEESSSEE